ncbi:large ribosomal subunit protein uL11m-like [Nomia melanderi]|uniref:large ribosomal subunit protein uL11m-like n=1 Tax=Nomia melanderi TaxID=2448451 RepID=UPI0013040F96|nr:39S ribosomal protein L11, mitochondrial-like [Nomia melanderi]
MAKKVLAKVNHSSKLRVIIPAGMASAKPLLGSQLGQRNINIVNFCKEFNQRTENIKHIYNHIKYSMVSICWWEQGTDPSLALMTLQQICQMLVGIVRTCGIEIVHSIDSVEHAEFMKQQQEESELFKTIKLLRTTA